jgi:hypothetical protein
VFPLISSLSISRAGALALCFCHRWLDAVLAEWRGDRFCFLSSFASYNLSMLIYSFLRRLGNRHEGEWRCGDGWAHRFDVNNRRLVHYLPSRHPLRYVLVPAYQLHPLVPYTKSAPYPTSTVPSPIMPARHSPDWHPTS